MQNELHFVGDLANVRPFSYQDFNHQNKSAVEIKLVCNERISQALLLCLYGNMCETFLRLNPLPGHCRIVAYFDMLTRERNGAEFQSIRPWKLEVTTENGGFFTITNQVEYDQPAADAFADGAEFIA